MEKGRFQRIVFEWIPVDKVKKVISVPQSAITKDIHTVFYKEFDVPGTGRRVRKFQNNKV